MTFTRPEESCEQPPPEQLLTGIDQFNNGEWYLCHETLEDLWAGESELVRDLYQGVLQVAVALHHWQGGNYSGAVSLLRKSVVLLGHVAPICRQVDVAGLIQDCERLREELELLGPLRMGELDPESLPVVRLVTIR